MAKLTKAQLAAHRQAVALLESGKRLSLDETAFVFENWHEGAGGDQTAASAFFTPIDLASDMLIDTPSYGSFVDLCAGTGRLAYFAGGQFAYEDTRRQYRRIVCVERNPAYVAIGKRLFPEAEWICGDALDPAVRRQIGDVDFAIANPPFGTTTRSDFEAPRYKGKRIDLAVMDVAATLAPDCWAIVPQNVATWTRRGDYRPSAHAEAFERATGHGIYRFSSIAPEYYADQWRGTSPQVEIVGFGEEFDLNHRGHTIIHGKPAPDPLPIANPVPAAAKVGEQLALFA